MMPKIENYIYLVNDDSIGNDPIVGTFTTDFVGFTHNTIISTATIYQINLVEAMHAGISCWESIGNNKTLHVTESSRKTKYF